MLLKDKVIFITGWTSWIWKSTVCSCLREGAKVAFTGRRDTTAKEVVCAVEEEGLDLSNLLFIKNDVTDAEWLKAAIEKTVDLFWWLNWVFANAGRHMVWNVVETTLEQWRNMFAVDVEWIFLTLKYAIPHIQKNKEGWSIVLMWSDQCLVWKGNSSAYWAAKWAIWQLTKSTAIDYAVDKIRVNAVCPGTIDTPLARGAMKWFAEKHFWWDFEAWFKFLEKAQPIQRLWKPSEVAELVTFILSDKVKFMTGSLVWVDGGYVAG